MRKCVGQIHRRLGGLADLQEDSAYMAAAINAVSSYTCQSQHDGKKTCIDSFISSKKLFLIGNGDGRSYDATAGYLASRVQMYIDCEAKTAVAYVNNTTVGWGEDNRGVPPYPHQKKDMKVNVEMQVDTRLATLLDGVGFLAVAGAISAIPYLCLVAYVTLIRKPSSEEELRQLSWAGPSWIAIACALLGSAVGTFHGGISAGSTTFAAVAILASVVGYVYAGLINGVLLCARRQGWVAE